MICSQIGDGFLNLYYIRLEEGYNCDDPLFSLWSSYHKELVSLLTAQKMTSSEAEDGLTQRKVDALAIRNVKSGTCRSKTLKLPPLISSPEFRSLLLQKEADAKAEEARKKQRKLDIEERK
ncbi:hypothetical protein PoB_005785100 [Plakobranchus ocellatus]|uniref:Uncharacterized protein n=1 Tax=Plakobranchus ocellatus TaxID=259542 RepID=A0AAV4C7Q9_9GAST|nr:hypothetical protein PoB_005785100 [Plakobranchus ocellatus]